jgi:hypothetical protein
MIGLYFLLTIVVWLLVFAAIIAATGDVTV